MGEIWRWMTSLTRCCRKTRRPSRPCRGHLTRVPVGTRCPRWHLHPHSPCSPSARGARAEPRSDCSGPRWRSSVTAWRRPSSPPAVGSGSSRRPPPLPRPLDDLTARGNVSRLYRRIQNRRDLGLRASNTSPPCPLARPHVVLWLLTTGARRWWQAAVTQHNAACGRLYRRRPSRREQYRQSRRSSRLHRRISPEHLWIWPAHLWIWPEHWRRRDKRRGERRERFK